MSDTREAIESGRKVAIEQRYLNMPLGEFLRELAQGTVPPQATVDVQTFCEGGRVLYWAKKAQRGDLPLYFGGRLLDMLG